MKNVASFLTAVMVAVALMASPALAGSGKTGSASRSEMQDQSDRDRGMWTPNEQHDFGTTVPQGDPRSSTGKGKATPWHPDLGRQ